MNKNILKNKKRVVFYLSTEDKELLNGQCELLQIRASFFIRNSVLEKLGKPIFNVKKQDLDTKGYISELIRIGVNLNQISKKLNSGVKFMLADQQTVLNDIKNINNHILEIKSKL
ncbi:plasmid mobilization protein [Lutibacter citreus]|uniref:plasmid mobilization protein n=1 Tax=Lutibacter citreus TaxID=2138210 RepID=UPI000DBE315E|nr:plasmid mobilization relaxosome protein MobC [Lutibacter citreus]